MKHPLSACRSLAECPFRLSVKHLAIPRSAALTVLCLAALALSQVGRADEVTFSKSRYSSVKLRREVDVRLTLTDSKILIDAKKTKKGSEVNLEIPFSSIDGVTYEIASRHRTGEGASVMLLSLGAGAVVMATKTKSHWLDIEYHEGDTKQLTVLRLDKSEYEQVLATLEARTGKHIKRIDAKNSNLNPTAMSKDVDEVVPFKMDAVVAAVKPAMESMGCNVTEAKGSHVLCKRARSDSERTGYGGEKITAELKPKGDQTHVRIWTGKGFVGRMRKNNWSTPIYNEMMKNLQQPAQSTKASGAN